MANIIPTKVPSYAAKIVLDLYENREEIVESYKVTAKVVADRAEPFIDAIVDTFSEVKEQAGEMSDESWVVTGFSRLFTYVKSIPERLEIEGMELPQSIDLIAFALIMTGSADCSS